MAREYELPLTYGPGPWIRASVARTCSHRARVMCVCVYAEGGGPYDAGESTDGDGMGNMPIETTHNDRDGVPAGRVAGSNDS